MTALIFVVLNLADAHLTNIALAAGASEANPIMASLGGNPVAKGLLALGIVVALYSLRIERVLWFLNILFIGVIFWNSATYLMQTAPLLSSIEVSSLVMP